MAKKKQRDYRGEDAGMLENAQTKVDLLGIVEGEEDLVLFTARFPWIDVAYVEAIQAGIDTANAIPLDTQVLADQRVLTGDVNAQMVLGQRALTDLGLYAKLTYKDDKIKQNVFGQSAWAKAFTNQKDLPDALEHAYDMANKAPYKADLEAKGFLAANATQLMTIAAAIRVRNRMQESAIADRPVATQDRIEHYNSVWAPIKEINIASQVIFAGNPAKLDQYKLYESSAATTTINFALTQEDGTTPLVNANVQITNTELAAKPTNDDGFVQFKGVNIPELINITVITEGGEEFTFENIDVMAGTTNEVALSVGG